MEPDDPKDDDLWIFTSLDLFILALVFMAGGLVVILGVPWWLLVLVPATVGGAILLREFSRR